MSCIHSNMTFVLTKLLRHISPCVGVRYSNTSWVVLFDTIDTKFGDSVTYLHANRHIDYWPLFRSPLDKKLCRKGESKIAVVLTGSTAYPSVKRYDRYVREASLLF